jgi:thiamine pyrophosphate-dependent acetolactate synthase large subunit-like protein
VAQLSDPVAPALDASAGVIAVRRRRGGTFVTEVLRALGIRQVFSVPGMQILSILDALPGAGIRLVVGRSERDATFFAEGYGHAAERPAVVMNTLGPGIANEMIGMESARRSGAPVLFVSPGHPPHKQKRLGAVFQGFDQQTFLAEIAKRAWVVGDAGELRQKLEAAYAECVCAPRGPVRVEVSFPILFERHAFGSPPAVQRDDVAHSRAPIFVYEARPPAGSVRPVAIGPRPETCRELWPGVPGHGVPFAVGARLADDHAPTIAFTSADLLIENVGSVSVAISEGLEVRIVDAASSPDPRLGRLANLFPATLGHATSRPALREMIFARPRALTIVCGVSEPFRIGY